jgi:hypothetical protein
MSYSAPSGFDFTGGYAITKRIAVMGGAYSHKNTDTEKEYSLFSSSNASSTLWYRHKGYHYGAGAYFPLSKKNTETIISFFGGYTRGSFRMDEHLIENTTTPAPSSTTKINFYKSKISRYFIQGGINYYNKNYEIAFISRYNYVGYTNVITDYTTDEQHSYRLPILGYPKFSQFLDIALDSKFFLTSNPRIGLQIFGSITPRLKRRDFNFDHYPFRLGIGIVFKNPFANNLKK